MNPLATQSTQRKVTKYHTIQTQKLVKQQKDAKHRMYVLDEWLKTQITYNQDICASITLIKPKMLEYKVIDQVKGNKLFPYFDQMLKLSDNMIEIVSTFKNVNIAEVRIGEKLNKIVSYYKMYLEYFKHKTQIKTLYEELEKVWAKQLKAIQAQLRNYFQQLYKQRAVTRSKLQLQPKDVSPAVTNPKANITIHDCLQRPLYRLFKYHLLIDSYMKKLPQTHPDYLPLKKTRQLFVQIGQKCNNSFTQQQRQDLKYKIEKLFGKSLPLTSYYKTTMSAQTLYFPCKLYVFSNLVIISKAEKMIGFRQEKPYINIGIDQFSFITYKKDIKYFKNILMFCGIYHCILFFLPDKGTRLQIHQLLSKLINEQKFNAFQKRQHRQIKAVNKLTFFNDQKEKPVMASLTGIKIEAIDIDMRNLGLFTNDTVFILSIAMPQYIDDEATFYKTSKIDSQNGSNLKVPKSQRDSLTKQQHVLQSRLGVAPYKKFQSDSQLTKSQSYTPINQHIQLHIDDLLKIYKELRERYPEIDFPQIDPFSKDFNFYTQSKKKTKSFEVRSFLIEEFFNFVFRHPSIMQNPLFLVLNLKVDEFFWYYIVQRSIYLQNDKRDDKMNPGQTPGNKYDQNHCKLCQETVIDSIWKVQQIRARMIKLQQLKPQNYCFNSFNLLRNNVLALPQAQFTSIERMLLYIQFFQGRFDYCFLYKKNLSKTHKIINILIPKLLEPQLHSQQSQNLFTQVCQMAIDHKTTVGMVVNSIGKDLQIYNLFDYRLVVEFNNGQLRILDQDELVGEIVDKYEIKYDDKTAEQTDSQFVGPRNSIKQSSFAKTTFGVFNLFKNIMPTFNKNQSKIYLKKLVWFPLYFEIDSIHNNFQRSKLIIPQVLEKISKKNITIPFEIWGQICGLYYCLMNMKQLNRTSVNVESPVVFKISQQIIPVQKHQLIKTKAFSTKMQSTVNERRKYLLSLSTLTQKSFYTSIHQRIIQIAYKYFKVNTWFYPVEAKRVPPALVMDSGILLSGQCFIGVNHSEIIVIRDKKNLTEVIRIPLQDVEIVHSVYSLFLTYRRENIESVGKDEHLEEFQLRFDSKMLHGFVQLCQKYKLIKIKFGAILSEYDSIN